MAAAVAISISTSSAFGGVADARYDLQYYLDFARNKGMFAAGATNISVYFKDGTSVINSAIPIMPNLDSYAQRGQIVLNALSPLGGANLVSPQFVSSAYHCYENDVYFLSEDGSTAHRYSSTGYSGENQGDWSMQRLDKIVTEVAYTPMADADFILSLTKNEWIYRLGNGGTFNTDGNSLYLNSNTLGGLVNVDSVVDETGKGDYKLIATLRREDGADIRPPLEIGVTQGDSGSPMFAWDKETGRFLYIGFLSAGYPIAGYGNFLLMRSNPVDSQNFINSCSTDVSEFSGTEKILWGIQDSASGKGVLTQGEISYDYTGQGTNNTLYDHLGLDFSTTDTENVQSIELQGSVNMGAGALTFDSGNWKLTEANTDFTFNSAGFVVNEGASLTLELTGTSAEEIRKVGPGTLTIAGNGNNEASLRVGGGETQYNVSYDDKGNITACTLGNIGETRLNRTDGYAASSVRLEAGVAIVVLMADNQFKTKSVAGDTFTFGNAGGLLNLNGHNLEWGVINQEGSGTGARIGNFTPLGENTPGTATFTYTGTGTFAGCFTDEGADSTAKLAVVYKNSAENASWTLTGNHSNAGGFTVEAGTMILQGSNTPHVHMTDNGDWTYATLEGSDVTVKSGATFRLSHHALMTGNVNVEDGGSFVLNQTVNAASESVGGSLRQDTEKLGITSLIGNVTLNGNATMTANTESPVATTIKGNITGTSSGGTQFTKQGSGILIVNGQVNVPAGSVDAGGLVIKDVSQTGNWEKWTIGERGFFAAEGMNNDDVLKYVSGDSAGVLALTSNQETEIALSAHQNLIIGAWGNVSYGTTDKTLGTVNDSTYGNVWRLGGGTGTLTVNFKLTGDADLLIGNEWSSGTVHLTNTANDFSGDIYISGSGNKLSYEAGALGTARVNLTYGNALALYEASQLNIIKEGSSGVLALGTDESLNLSGTALALGANGAYTYTGNLTVDEKYRFGGSGHLTLDTELASAISMEIDGQGTTGSSVTFARENAFSGTITAGGGLYLSSANSAGDIGIHVGHESALAAAEAVVLRKGAILYTEGKNITVRNLSVEGGAYIINDGNTDTTLTLDVSSGKTVTVVNGAVSDAQNIGTLHLVKKGAGTLSLGNNTSWSGGLTIKDGSVSVSAYSNSGITVGLGATDMPIVVEKNGILDLTFTRMSSGDIDQASLPQFVSGNGTVRVSSGGALMFSDNVANFSGTVEVAGNTRLYIGRDFYKSIAPAVSFSNQAVFNNATVSVASGSQVRITNMFRYGKVNGTAATTSADFIIAGTGFAGTDNGSYGSGSPLKVATLNGGALSVDLGSVVTGNVTLAEDATISSWSNNATGITQWGGYMYGTSGYGIKNNLGGTVRGKILGEGKTLTISGNEGMTFTADSANTYGDLKIANSNGNNDDKFALRLNGGKAVSQTSTALGTGTVTLGENLILRLAGTGTANNTDVVYTYGNAISAGNDSTLQSYNITNRLTGTVTMSGSTLNLATANGGVFELAGGISGNGTLNIAANSKIILGSENSARETTAQFSGNIAAAAGTDFTLASPSFVAETTTFSGTDSLTLRLSGTNDYTLGGITVADSDAADSAASSLTLNFDFTDIPSAKDANSFTTLFSDISAGSTTVSLSLNLFNDIESGTYTLATGTLSGDFSLENTLNNRLSLTQNNGSLILTVGTDNRLYWAADGATQTWDTTSANWYQESSGGNVAFTSGAFVVFGSKGAANSTENSRETITLAADQTVGALVSKDANVFYEITGEAALSGDTLTVGEGGNLKLSTASANFTGSVRVDGTSVLEVSKTALTANVSATDGATFSLSDAGTLNGNLNISDAEASIRNATIAGNIAAAGNGKLILDSATISGARSFSFDGAGTLATSENATLGGTFTFADKQTALQVNNMSVSSGALTSSAALDVDALSLASETSLTLTHATGSTTEIDAVSGNGSLEKNSAGNLNLGSATLSGLTLKGGGTSAISGKVTVSGHFSLGKETVNLVNGADVTVGQYTSGNTANSQPTQLTIGEGASLTITGNNDTDSTSNSILLAHWKTSDSKLTLAGGTLTAQNTSMLMGWDSGATFEASSGTANLKGIRFSAQRNNSERLILGSAESGSARINLGSGGISGIGTNDSVLLGNGTIGANADFSVSGAGTVQLVATTGSTVFDTNAHKITVNTALTGMGNLTKQGAGTLLISGNGSGFSGNIAVEAGALAVDAVGKNILTSAASVKIGGNATLDLSALDFSDGANRIAVDTGTSVSFANTSTVAFANLAAGTEYGIFNISGGALDGWSTLTASNFTLGGTKLSDMGRVELSLGMSGSFSYTITDGWDLTWNGGNEKTTWNQNAENKVWQTNRPDITTGEMIVTTTGYMNNDNVVFNSDADLNLEGNIRVKNMTVAEGVNLKTNGTLAITGTLNLGANTSWNFSGNTTQSFTEEQLKAFAVANSALVVGEGATLTMTDKETEQNKTSTAFDKVSGSGNVVLNLSADNGTGFNLDQISGNITVAAGRLQVNTSKFNEASDILLTSNQSQLVFNGTGTELKNDVVLGSSTTIHANSGCSGTISGFISGNGELTKAGAGTLTFKEQNTYTGVTTISGGKIVLDTAGDYHLMNTVTGIGGTLEVAGGTTVYSSADTAHKIATNLRINKGGVFSFDGKGNDHFQANVSGTVTVDGGILDFGNSCQILRMFTNITLSNGAELRGEGAIGSAGYAAAMEFNNNSTINVTSGNNTISATTRLNGGNARTLTYNVSEGATLNVIGRIHADSETILGNINKNGEGTATLSARAMLNKVEAKDGEIGIAYTGDDGNTIGILDGSAGSTAIGSFRLKENAKLNVSSALWGRTQTSVILEKNSALTHGNVEFSNNGNADATLKATAENQQFSIGSANWALTNGHAKSTVSEAATLAVKLVSSSVENAGSGTLTVNNSGNSVSGVVASTGNIVLTNQANELSLTDLTVAEGLTVSAYADASATEASEAEIRVAGTASFGAGAHLNANLTLASGATLEVGNGGLSMGSSVTLNQGIFLSDSTLANANALKTGETLTLFTGVDYLVLMTQDGKTVWENSSETLSSGERIIAGSYFTNLSGDSFELYFTGAENGGTIGLLSIPEPSAFGLIAGTFALALVASRRKRAPRMQTLRN